MERCKKDKKCSKMLKNHQISSGKSQNYRFCTVSFLYLQGNSGKQAPRGKSQRSKKRRVEILQEIGTLPKPLPGPLWTPPGPPVHPPVYIMWVCVSVGVYVCMGVCMCVCPKSPLNRNSAYRMIQIAFWAHLGRGKGRICEEGRQE